MSENRSQTLQAIGAGLMCAAIAGIGFGMLNKAAPWADYIQPMLFAFMVGSGVTMILTLPATLIDSYGEMIHNRRMRVVELERSRPQPIPPPAPPKADDESLRRAAWRLFFLLGLAESIRLDSCSYQAMRGFFNDDAEKWHAWLDPLVKWGKVWPVQNGQETFYRNITPQQVYDLLYAGEMPPCPSNLYPPDLKPRQQSRPSKAEKPRKSRSTPATDTETA